MSSQKPRIALTVSDDLNDILSKISDLTETPKSKIITGILNDSMSVFIELLTALEKIKEDSSSADTVIRQMAANTALDACTKIAKFSVK